MMAASRVLENIMLHKVLPTQYLDLTVTELCTLLVVSAADTKETPL